jgi:uncharacterized cupin superfamily protein
MGEGGRRGHKQGQKYRHLAIDQMESIWGGGFKRARAALGVTAFGLGIMELPPHFDRIPSHVHTFDGQEEVYIPLAGAGMLKVGSRSIPLDPHTAVRVGPTASRAITAGPAGISVLIASGTPGRAYEPFAQMELGAPEPDPASLPGILAARGIESSDDVIVTAIDPADAFSGVRLGVTFHPLGRKLATSAFGLSMVELQGPEGASDYPLHSHEADEQVEVFVIAEGSGVMRIDEAEIAVAAGEMIAVDPAAARTLHAAEGGLRFFVIGAPGGKPYAGSSPTIN